MTYVVDGAPSAVATDEGNAVPPQGGHIALHPRILVPADDHAGPIPPQQQTGLVGGTAVAKDPMPV